MPPELISELIEAIKTVLIEAVKILGPAILTFLGTHKVMSAQYDLKISEIEKGNKFEAAKIVFDLYKERYVESSQIYTNITNELLTINGMIIGTPDIDTVSDMHQKVANLSKSYKSQIPYHIDLLFRELEPLKNVYELEYSELLKAKKIYEDLEEPTLDNYVDYTLNLQKIYSVISLCNQALCGNQMDKSLKKYIEEE